MQSCSQILTSNIPTPAFFTGQMPFLLPNQQRQSNEGRKSLCFNSRFPGEPGLASFIGAKDDGSGGDNWSYKTCKAAVTVITTNKSTPNLSHFTDLHTPSSPVGLPILSLTTNSSWLPWERVAMPLISPQTPIPQLKVENVGD